MTWTWSIDGLGTTEQTLTIYDHNGDEATSKTREGWSGDEPEEVVLTAMHDRCAILREDLQRGGGSSPIDMGKIIEYFAVIEDMAGEQIERAE